MVRRFVNRYKIYELGQYFGGNAQMRMIMLGMTVLILSGCGVAYFSPDLSEDDPNIDIIPLTADSITQANASPYTPCLLYTSPSPRDA